MFACDDSVNSAESGSKPSVGEGMILRNPPKQPFMGGLRGSCSDGSGAVRFNLNIVPRTPPVELKGGIKLGTSVCASGQLQAWGGGLERI